jgi:hypothetical protein
MKIQITGNTYPHKDQLKALGCRWDGAAKCWVASSEDMAEKAKAIVGGGAKTVARRPATASRAPRRQPIALRAPGSAQTREGEVQIPKLSDPAIITAFFGKDARNYDYTVTHDDFDEYDMEGPGEYFGVNVPAELGKKWDAGIQACKAAGVETRGREGLAIRLEIMHGTREIPSALEKSLADKEQAAAEKAAAEQAEKDRAAHYAAHKEGFVSVGADQYSGEYWTLDKRATLEKVASFEPAKQPQYSRESWTLYRLPNGDLMEIIHGQSWTRWSKNTALIADREMRSSIVAHRYALPLAAALSVCDLDSGICVWLNFGKNGREEFAATGRLANYSGTNSPTGPEKVVRLRSYLSECIARQTKFGAAEKVAALEAALVLATDDSITHEFAK